MVRYFWKRPAGDPVDHLVGALSREDDGHEQLPVAAEVEHDAGLGILGPQTSYDFDARGRTSPPALLCSHDSMQPLPWFVASYGIVGVSMRRASGTEPGGGARVAAQSGRDRTPGQASLGDAGRGRLRRLASPTFLLWALGALGLFMLAGSSSASLSSASASSALVSPTSGPLRGPPGRHMAIRQWVPNGGDRGAGRGEVHRSSLVVSRRNGSRMGGARGGRRPTSVARGVQRPGRRAGRPADHVDRR